MPHFQLHMLFAVHFVSFLENSFIDLLHIVVFHSNKYENCTPLLESSILPPILLETNVFGLYIDSRLHVFLDLIYIRLVTYLINACEDYLL